MVSLASLVIPLLAVWLWWPVRTLSRPARLAAIVLTALIGCGPMLLLKLLQARRIGYPTVAYLQVPGGAVLTAVLILAVFMLVRDAAWLAARVGGSAAWARRLHCARLTAGATLAALAVGAVGVYHGLQPPEVRERTLALPSLPPALDGLRVAVLADIHASPINDARYVQTVVDRTLAARPDVIVLPGDLVDGDVGATGPHVAPLARLSAPLGVWAAPGNHEYYSGYDAWMGEFRRLGLSLLENRAEVLNVNGARLAISGIGDPAYGQTSAPGAPNGIPPDAAAVARQAQEAGADFHVLLAHQPKFARDNAALGFDLQISGHTHGGHILGMDQWLVAPFNNGFVRGLYEIENMRLWLSSGAGLWAGFATRLGVAPAIDLLILRRGGDH